MSLLAPRVVGSVDHARKPKSAMGMPRCVSLTITSALSRADVEGAFQGLLHRYAGYCIGI
jgi:hypothetical protein